MKLPALWVRLQSDTRMCERIRTCRKCSAIHPRDRLGVFIKNRQCFVAREICQRQQHAIGAGGEHAFEARRVESALCAHFGQHRDIEPGRIAASGLHGGANIDQRARDVVYQTLYRHPAVAILGNARRHPFRIGAHQHRWAAGLQRLARAPLFDIRAIRVEGEVSRNSESTIRANAAPRLAGSFLTLAAFNAFFFNMVNGRGWVCVALVVFASWRPGKALLGALLFAFFDALQLRLQQAGGGAFGLDLPYQVYLMLPYAMAMVALVLVARRAAYPQALMKPYRKGER